MSAPAASLTGSYQKAAKALMRQTVFDAVGAIVRDRGWAKLTMTNVAGLAGLSRQTLYNEFASRHGLACAYALHLAQTVADTAAAAIDARPGRVHAALDDACAGVVTACHRDPVVAGLVGDDCKPDLLRIFTTDADVLIVHATDRLADRLEASWLALTPARARAFAATLLRLGLALAVVPPGDPASARSDVVSVLEAFVSDSTRRRRAVAPPLPTQGVPDSIGGTQAESALRMDPSGSL